MPTFNPTSETRSPAGLVPHQIPDAMFEQAALKTLVLDESTTYLWTDNFGPVDNVILGSASDDADKTGHSYVIELNDRDFRFVADYMTIDGSALKAGGAGTVFDEYAQVSTEHVTRFNALITTGAAADAVRSGAGSDTIDTGAGNDYVSIGSGRDQVTLGDGDDWIDSLESNFDHNDIIDAGDGVDELSLYYQDISDADFLNVSSVEILGLSSGGDLELDRNAFRTGVNTLYVDNAVHRITVGEHFKGDVTFNMMGDFSGQTRLDASHSKAVVTVHSEYVDATTRPVLFGGMGKHDTIYLSSGFEGGFAMGGDLSGTKHFEHVIIHSDAGGGGAFVTLATKAGQIESKFQTLDGSALTASDALVLNAAGSTASIRVQGGGAADTLVLGSGADHIEAGGGADLLTGGRGGDVFIYSALSDSSSADVDAITDFHSGQDRIDVRGIGADLADLHGEVISFFGNQDGGAGDDDAFAATGANGALDAVFRSDTHTLWFDTNDNGALDAEDLHMVLDGVSGLRAADVLSGHLVV
jgi:Ca2+-binding RTX toxin-like protein